MPFHILSVDEVTQHLNLTGADIEQLVKAGDIPFEKCGDRVVFRQTDIDAWASQRILKFSSSRLTEYHRKSSQRTRNLLQREALLPELIRPDYIAPAMTAKTKASVVRDLAALAGRTGLVCGAAEPVASLLAREKLCPTARLGSMTFLYPRQPQPYLSQSSFLMLGRSIRRPATQRAAARP